MLTPSLPALAQPDESGRTAAERRRAVHDAVQNDRVQQAKIVQGACVVVALERETVASMAFGFYALDAGVCLLFALSGLRSPMVNDMAW